MPRIILDSGTEAGLLHHLDIELCALSDALGFKKLITALKIKDLLFHLSLDGIACLPHAFGRNDVEGSRVDCLITELCFYISGERVDRSHAVDLVTEEFNSYSILIIVGRDDFKCVPLHPERTAVEIHLISLILHIDEFTDELIAVFGHTGANGGHHICKILRSTDAIDARDGCNNDDIAALAQGRQSGQTQLVNLVIDGGVLGNVGVRRWHIRLRLVIIIVGNEVLDGILREEFLEFTVELGRQSLIVRYDQRGLLELGDYVRHRKSLAGTRDTEERLGLVSFSESFDKLADGLGLVTGRFVV